MTRVLGHISHTGSYHLLPLHQKERTRKKEECSDECIYREILSIDPDREIYTYPVLSGKDLYSQEDFGRKVLIYKKSIGRRL